MGEDERLRQGKPLNEPHRSHHLQGLEFLHHSLSDLDNLPEPDDLAEDIIENLEAGLNSFRQVLVGLETP